MGESLWKFHGDVVASGHNKSSIDYDWKSIYSIVKYKKGCYNIWEDLKKKSFSITAKFKEDDSTHPDGCLLKSTYWQNTKFAHIISCMLYK